MSAKTLGKILLGAALAGIANGLRKGCEERAFRYTRQALDALEAGARNATRYVRDHPHSVITSVGCGVVGGVATVVLGPVGGAMVLSTSLATARSVRRIDIMGLVVDD